MKWNDRTPAGVRKTFLKVLTFLMHKIIFRPFNVIQCKLMRWKLIDI